MPSDHPITRHQQRLVEALDALPEPANRVAELHNEGKSLKEIGKSLDLDDRDVNFHWTRVREAIADVGPYEPDEPTLLSQWSPAEARQACHRAWSAFDHELADHYAAYV